ncbi:uncharacterized protein EAE97_000022 [Botrytis byssoidea]|uniref:Uncharacterized protein n=1 Tax=Botrytis byssoidea TaxID=139641 RepID=A0A9P5M3Z5_9HELO|nr:uncharacterized protein EAE97_000022 [Botrytis byssoidea]KAF7954763.1 hypothetical protein EAE97_000022 [Botrytis byssoidea]
MMFQWSLKDFPKVVSFEKDYVTKNWCGEESHWDSSKFKVAGGLSQARQLCVHTIYFICRLIPIEPFPTLNHDTVFFTDILSGISNAAAFAGCYFFPALPPRQCAQARGAPAKIHHSGNHFILK